MSKVYLKKEIAAHFGISIPTLRSWVLSAIESGDLKITKEKWMKRRTITESDFNMIKEVL